MATQRIAITCGEPAGVGPDLTIALAQQAWPQAELVAIADPDLLRQRAQQLGLPLSIRTQELPNSEPRPNQPGEIAVLPVTMAEPCQAGQLNPANAAYVLETLSTAIEGCEKGLFNAMVTAPVHKAVINDAGVSFSGHTEFLAEQTGTEQVVMMLATEGLRVALATTHIPLSQVSKAISAEGLEKVINILWQDLHNKFAIAEPRITVLGLNPHAGEGGHMGTEEIDTIIPCLERLRANGMQLTGPLPADTAFTPKHLNDCDAVLAMYHDQGLPVLKYKGFGQAVNITLGLPIIRTSVDHGTALDLAGSGNADTGSLQTALNYAISMATARALGHD